MHSLKNYLSSLEACDEAIEWAGNRRLSKAAWRACPNPCWLLWLAQRIGISARLANLAVCDVAESVIHLVHDYDAQIRNAIGIDGTRRGNE